MTLYTGADTIGGDIGLLPDGLNMYASYVDNFGGYGELVARFGNAPWKPFLLSITIFGNHARCADVENGAMRPADLPHWYDNVAISDSVSPPWVYTSASNMGAVAQAMGGRKHIRWSAHFGAGEHICGPGTCGFPQADWTQWDDHGAHGENIDRSVGNWFPPSLTPAPIPKEIQMALTAAELNGVPHVFYEDKNGDVYYTYQPQNAQTPGPDRAWVGGQQGVSVAGWKLFAKAAP